MSRYRRNYVPGGTFFFTVVTFGRQPILTTELGRRCLHDAICEQQEKRPFHLFATVLLPDHLHAIWTLPEGDSNYSLRWQQIKERFTHNYLAGGGEEGQRTESRLRRRERSIWQRRFWEHTCRDEDDLVRCTDYVHWNPMKHGLVERVCNYRWSTFQRFVEEGAYERNWGATNPCPGYHEPEWE